MNSADLNAIIDAVNNATMESPRCMPLPPKPLTEDDVRRIVREVLRDAGLI